MTPVQSSLGRRIRACEETGQIITSNPDMVDALSGGRASFYDVKRTEKRNFALLGGSELFFLPPLESELKWACRWATTSSKFILVLLTENEPIKRILPVGPSGIFL